MQICTSCVLDERYPGISYDKNGICIYCRQSKIMKLLQINKNKYEKKFLELIDTYKGKNRYDCLVAYSGGKDSTYTLYLLQKKYNLNILALTYDNWFQSETAQKNIREVVKSLNISHLTFLPSFDVFKKIILLVVAGNIYSMKAMERASSICTTCISLIRFMCFRVAIEMEIPFVIFGMSPGQAPIVTSVVKTNAEMVRKTQDLLFQSLYRKLGDIIRPYFLEERHFQKTAAFPYNINPLAFSTYDDREILDTAKSLGWVKPEDTDANSTNCLLNSLANALHINKFGFNPYAYEIAELVRDGYMTREQGLNKLSAPTDNHIISHVKQKLGMG